MKLMSIDQSIKLYWNFKIMDHVLIIKLSLLDQQSLAQETTKFIEQNS